MILCAVRNVVSNCKKNFCMLRLQTQKSYGTLRLTYRGLFVVIQHNIEMNSEVCFNLKISHENQVMLSILNELNLQNFKINNVYEEVET